VSLSVLGTNTKGGCGKTTIATTLATAFATAGFKTALADVDRQKSSLGWLATRPATAAPITGLDWRKSVDPVPSGTQRLVIDVPAGLRLGHVEDLLKSADVVIVPVLASVFDERSTSRFLKKLDGIKPIAKGRKRVLVVANRLRSRQKSAQRLLDHLATAGFEPTAQVADRTLYGELAVSGLGLFDLDQRRAAAGREEWLPLLVAIERAAAR
jgi:chromosome partitioning protein